MSNIFCSNINHINWLKTIPLMDDGEIHVHCFALPENSSLLVDSFYLLNDDEKAKAEKYHQLNDGILYKLGRTATKLLLSVYNNCNPKEIEIFGLKNKKPQFKISSASYQPLVSDFNISHAQNILLIAFGKDEVGIDVEEINEFTFQDVMQKSFTGDEINFVMNNQNPPLAFYTIWTRKEALLKTTGIGIIDELSNFQVLNGMNETTLGIFKNKNYSVFTFPVNEFYTGSISYETVNKKKIKFIKTNLSQFI